jgi:acyl-homoserine lactone acylase PvdQ
LVLFAQVPLAHTEADTLRVAGLSQPVGIVRDRWGIPHIYARNEADLFFVPGYNAARDRLFQADVLRLPVELGNAPTSPVPEARDASRPEAQGDQSTRGV